MRDPIRPTEPGDDPAVPVVGLDRLRPRTPARIVRVDQRLGDELRRDGLGVGEVVSVAGRGPFGGPLIVDLDRVRVAVPLDVARAVAVMPLSGEPVR